MTYYAGAYTRLSKEDEQKAGKESNSILNQKELIRSFLLTQPEIQLIEEYADDGFSGVDFLRPGFQQMLEDIEKGKINCVVVKDLSRLGRNYIEAGWYLEEWFPAHNVRFLSIGENYDSLSSLAESQQLLLPILNLINDHYSRDISKKVRTSLEVKRQKGEYVGAFPPFGYRKSKNRPYHLVQDFKEAQIVRRIFRLFQEGYSSVAIANQFNQEGIASPLEAKRAYSLYHCSFQTNGIGQWHPATVRKILQNPVYLGILEQGKTYGIHYKLKTRMKREKENWYRHEDAHEPIITQKEFDTVQKLFKNPSRTSPTEEKQYLLSGFLECAFCKEKLTRRQKTRNGKTYVYYGCYDREKKQKHPVSVSEEKIEQAFQETLQKQMILQMGSFSVSESIPFQDKKHQIFDIKAQIKRCQEIKKQLEEDYQNQKFNIEEYQTLKKAFQQREKAFFQKKEKLEKQKKSFPEEWNRYFLFTFLDKGIVYSKNRICIFLSFQNPMEVLC